MLTQSKMIMKYKNKAFLKQKQMQDEGALDLEIMQNDESYIDAMAHGMPPCAGCGIGIDRFCMLLLGQTSIREIIMFPMFRSSVLKDT